jgi:predicted ATP-grasp superfamily ATP-dependent carboligase
MQILLYEYTTGSGLLGQPDDAELASLLREGAAMISAVADDFCASGIHRVQVLRDARLRELEFHRCEVIEVESPGQDEQRLAELAGKADWTLIIAPETGGALASRCRTATQAGGRWLGPSLEFTELAADKHRTAERLRQCGVPAPRGISLEQGERLPLDFTWPAVLKPRDGCGSQNIRLIPTAAEAAAVAPLTVPTRLEAWQPGLPASVSFLCGSGVRYALPPCRQILSDDGAFKYEGGSYPLPPGLARRAQLLAARALAAFPQACGYVGLDLVLGASANGSQDCVIEINPRLTTSYVGLRAACRDNLAEAMLHAAVGQTPRLSFFQSGLEFHLDGATRRTE